MPGPPVTCRDAGGQGHKGWSFIWCLDWLKLIIWLSCEWGEHTFDILIKMAQKLGSELAVSLRLLEEQGLKMVIVMEICWNMFWGCM